MRRTQGGECTDRADVVVWRQVQGLTVVMVATAVLGRVAERVRAGVEIKFHEEEAGGRRGAASGVSAASAQGGSPIMLVVKRSQMKVHALPGRELKLRK
jgi:hypothetical protein